MARKRNKGLAPLGGALEKALKAVDQKSLVTLGILAHKWGEVVGENLRDKSAPIRLRERELTIATTSSVWTDSMSYLKPTILEKVSQLIGRDKVTRLLIITRPDAAEPIRPTNPGARQCS